MGNGKSSKKKENEVRCMCFKYIEIKKKGYQRMKFTVSVDSWSLWKLGFGVVLVCIHCKEGVVSGKFSGS